jgi:hypothetical protein
MSRKEALLERMRQAFRDVPVPHGPIAPSAYPGELEDFQVIQGRPRDALSDDDIWQAIGNINLHLLSAEAMQYYWPRFVECALKSGERHEELLTHILFLLSRADDPYAKSQFALFSVTQRQCVAEFLGLVREDYMDAVRNRGPTDELEKAQSIWPGR